MTYTLPTAIPQVRAQPWYPGQFGVPGSDVQRGLRVASRGVVMYVDPSHSGATAAGDGTNPESPLNTLQAAITNLTTWFQAGFDVDYSTIIVSGGLNESISITDYTLYPSYCSIIGVGPGPFSPVWENSDAATPCLILGPVGWRVAGFRFYVPSTAAAVVVPCTQAPYGANAIGIRSILEYNYFDGSVYDGLYGIDLHGAPYNVTIQNNVFGFIQNVANNAFCIVSTNTGFADAYRAYIANNWFHECDNGIDASLNVSCVVDNLFQTKGQYPMIMVLDLRLGTRGENLVSRNVFEGADYSQPGGFWANAAAPGDWTGNICGDTAEAEVGDNGWTILPPAP